MALSEIEKLERRYAENPQGLTFAPLAEVHRKNGDVARALELLGPGLQQHPDYIPASIVLGRCHLDRGDLPSAEAAFNHVLSLDGENVIALKALADIGERQHHFDDAERRLNTLLALDHSNDEARLQLQRIEAARAQASEAAARSAEVVAVAPAVEPEIEAAADVAPLELEGLEHSAGVEHAHEPVHEPPPAGLQVEETEVVEQPVEPLPGIIGRDLEPPVPDHFMLETSEDIVLRSSGGSEFQVPDASQELFAVVPPTESSGWDVAAPEPFEPKSPEPKSPEPKSPEPKSPELVSPELESPEPESPEPEFFEPEPEPVAEMEETADLEPFAEPDLEPERQGELEPLPILQAEPAPQAEPETPAEPEPQPIAVQEAEPVVAQPEAEPVAAGTTVAAPLVEPSPAPRRPLTAAETGGESVRGFFRRMLAARPAVAPRESAARAASTPPTEAPDSSGAPTRPAADALSLSSVFGEETSAHPPAVPTPGASEAGVSFDEFFSPPGAAPGARAARSPEPKNDDLDQFHAWLQNLKR